MGFAEKDARLGFVTDITDLTPKAAIIAPVAAAEPVVGEVRARLDPAAGWGVPAHVTILFPFVPPTLIDASTIESARQAIVDLRPVQVTFSQIRWFDDRVLYLAPEPDDWFRLATDRLCSAFPDYPPYGGVFDDVVPHLTVADRANLEEMQAAEAVVEKRLPIACVVDHLWLMTGTARPDGWHVVTEFPFSAE
jgi:2'-5' RNA ligase